MPTSMRKRGVKRAIDVARIIKNHPGIPVTGVYSQYVASFNTVCKRTIYRDIQILVEMGYVDVLCGSKRPTSFVFVDNPISVWPFQGVDEEPDFKSIVEAAKAYRRNRMEAFHES